MPEEERDEDVQDLSISETLEEKLTIRQTALLENPPREEIVALLEQRPGLNRNQIRRTLDLNRNTIDYHVSRLEQAGVVVLQDSEQENEELCFLTTDEDLCEQEPLRILFGRKSKRNVAIYITENPGTQTKEIAQALDLGKASVLHHIRTLREHGAVKRVGRSVETSYFPTEMLQEQVEEFANGYPRPWEEE